MKTLKLEETISTLEGLCLFLEPYLPLTNAHNTDFFTHNHWKMLLMPLIADDLLKLTMDQLKSLPNGKIYLSDFSSISIKQDVSRHEKSKIVSERHKWDHSVLPDWKHKDLKSYVQSCKQHSLPNLNVLSSHDELFACFDLKHTAHSFEVDCFMSAKKSHEVHIMARTCAAVCRSTGVENIIDIGSGKGYLSTELAFQHGLKVLGVDSSSINTNSANGRKGKLGKYWPGLVRKATAEKSIETSLKCTCQNNEICKCEKVVNDSNHKLCNVTQYVTTETDLILMFQDAFGILNPQQRIMAMTGLHTCGNLASTMLKIFTENAQTGLLFNIGCCYHLIDEEFVAGPYEKDDTCIKEFGFPLSQYLRSRGFKLGRNSRMLACQAVDRLVAEEKLPDDSLFYRAVLQVILQDLTGEIRNDWQIGKIAKKSSNFVDYTLKALKKLKINHDLSEIDIEAYLSRFSVDKVKLICYFQLRACLAPCVEAVILLDRLLFLLEKDTVNNALLVEMFDPIKSPRCYSIIAMKPVEQK